MGICASKKEQLQQKMISSTIENELREQALKREVKLLLLGPGECGKSTILKQLRIMNNQGFTDEELLQRKVIIYGNTVRSMATILMAMGTLQIAFDVPEKCENDAKRVLALAETETDDKQPKLDNEIYLAMSNLWSDAGVKSCYERRSEYQLLDSAKYFLDNLERIKKADYKPSNQDVLHTRVATMGVAEVEFELRDLFIRVFDVGGQKSERRKWINCFDDVKAVMFLVALSEYDQTLREDQDENRMKDSLALYDQICNMDCFVDAILALFLNKIDLFREKISRVPLTVCFTEYSGENTYNAGIEFVRNEFQKLNRSNRNVYIHETCVTDTRQIQKVLKSVIDTIIEHNTKRPTV